MQKVPEKLFNMWMLNFVYINYFSAGPRKWYRALYFIQSALDDSDTTRKD